MVAQAIIVCFIYSAVLFLGGLVIKRLKLIKKPMLKKGFLLSTVKISGMITSLIGWYLFAYSYWGNVLKLLGIVGGILLCLLGLSLGVIASMSESFYGTSGSKQKT